MILSTFTKLENPSPQNMLTFTRNFSLLILCFYSSFSFAQGNGKKEHSPDYYNNVMHKIAVLLQEGHYSPRELDDAFSADAFKKFIRELDEDRNIFLQSDIQSLSMYELIIDDELLGQELKSFFEIEKVYRKRLAEVSEFMPSLLNAPFNFNNEDVVELNPDKLQHPANEKARLEVWKKRLKYMTLTRFSDMQDDREKNREKPDFVVKADSTLEREAREQVLKQMNRFLSTRKNKENTEENFSTFMNVITAMMDPHTNYFPPIDLRTFNEGMSGRIYGIGAQLREDDGKIKIVSLVTGGPAWKSGEIQENDEIMKVGQGSEEPVDVTGYAVSEAVKLIKGSSKGSIVNLTMRKPDGSIKIVSLVRDEIKLDETFVRSAIINHEEFRIGYIFLPEFYVDFERFNGARCSVDMAKELEKLKSEKVDGIVIDLRGNGGGSLPEVVQMVGLFIEDGPVCQVKGKYDTPTVLRDKDKSVLYDGPLAVMVDEFSASASEIFAAAIQDYKRGVIIGSTSTYGKGTVQRQIPVANELLEAVGGPSKEDMGSVKLTLQKFYRVNGGSTQLKGITPDIILPDRMEYMKFREKDQTASLPWDTIKKAEYKIWTGSPANEEVIKAVNGELPKHPVFTRIKERVDWVEKNNNKIYSLKLEKYKADQKNFKNAYKEIDELYKLATPLKIDNIPADTMAINSTKEKSEKNRLWIKRVGEDIYVDKSLRIMERMIRKNNIALRSK